MMSKKLTINVFGRERCVSGSPRSLRMVSEMLNWILDEMYSRNMIDISLSVVHDNSDVPTYIYLYEVARYAGKSKGVGNL